MSWKVISSIEEMKNFYEASIGKIRETAKKNGYAIGLHGSMTRDLDLIAAPWVEEFSNIDKLAKEIQIAVCGFSMERYEWEEKPNGRMATCFPICFIDYQSLKDERPSLGHIDLSVMVGK